MILLVFCDFSKKRQINLHIFYPFRFRISSQRSEQLGSPTSIVNSVFGPSSPVASPQQSQLQSPIDVFYQHHHQQHQYLSPKLASSAQLRLSREHKSASLSPREQPFNQRHDNDYSNFWKYHTNRGPKTTTTRWQLAERNPASWSHDAATGCRYFYHSRIICKCNHFQKQSNKPKKLCVKAQNMLNFCEHSNIQNYSAFIV